MWLNTHVILFSQAVQRCTFCRFKKRSTLKQLADFSLSPMLPLVILPSDDIDTPPELAAQKCLLPKNAFNNSIKPGIWMKCFWETCSYAVCQLFPKDSDLTDHCFCYLNANVSFGKGMPKNLIKLEQLHLVAVISVEYTINLNENVYIKNFKRYTLAYLQNAVETFLQTVSCCVGCDVATPELQAMGIASITICKAHIKGGECPNDNVFLVTESTQLLTQDVRIVKKFADFDSSISLCFARISNELQMLLKFAKEPQRFGLANYTLIIGPSGCGKSSLISAALASEHCNYFTITADRVIGQYPGETEANLRKIFEAALHFCKNLQLNALVVVLLDNLHQLCPATFQTTTATGDASNSMRILTQLIHLIDKLRSSKVLCLATTNNIDSLPCIVRRPGRFEREILMRQPTEEERKQILLHLMEKQLDIDSISSSSLEFILKKTQGYVLADLALLVQVITQSILRKTNECKPEKLIEMVVRNFNPAGIKSSDVTVIKPNEGFKSIAGMQRLKRELKVSLLSAYQQEPALKRFGLRVPKGILLYGAPGCGKTKFAKCLAYEANMTFIATSGAEVYSPYVGAAEKFMARIFDTARRNAPCLIFLDEIDTLVGKRQNGEQQQQHDVQLRILSTLLTEMDGIMHATSTAVLAANYNIMVVAATNRPDMLDDALLRPGRFDKLVHVPPPDEQSRLELLQLHASTQPFAKDVNLEKLVLCTTNYSGADISNLCNEAAIHALHRDENAMEIQAEDFEVALTKVKSSLTASDIEKYYAIERSILR